MIYAFKKSTLVFWQVISRSMIAFCTRNQKKNLMYIEFNLISLLTFLSLHNKSFQMQNQKHTLKCLQMLKRSSLKVSLCHECVQPNQLTTSQTSPIKYQLIIVLIFQISDCFSYDFTLLVFRYQETCQILSVEKNKEKKKENHLCII